MQIDEISAVVADDMALVEQSIIENRKSAVSLAVEVADHIGEGGKRLRPLVVILCARACGYEGDDHICLATVIEYVHTATLLHDDVVDESSLRRGKPTANQQFGNSASILVGDFLYSRAFELMILPANLKILTTLAHATNIIAQGEVLQLMNRHNPYITPETYLQIIQSKTGQLFGVAGHIAGILGDLSDAESKQLQAYGMHLGTAFQLIDDVLDYNAETIQLGKNIGDDLAEGCPTLPLIYALEHGTEEQRSHIRHCIQKGELEGLELIQEIIESVGAIDYATAQAIEQSEKAKEAIRFLPASPYKIALEKLADFAISRKY